MNRYFSAMRTVSVVAYDGMRAFDYGVVAEVWGVDRTASGAPAFELRRCAAEYQRVRMEPGAEIGPTHGLDGLRGADLIVVLGRVDPYAEVPERLAASLRDAHAQGVPIAALCTGAFTLGAAGLLDGRRATTHWLHAGRLAECCPTATVEPDVLFVEDCGVWTSAGTAGGIDLCLHLVRRAHGAQVAGAIARRMVTAAHREGGQAQFIERPVPAASSPESVVAATLEWATTNLHRQVTVDELARRANMATRTYARHFRVQTGTTPGRWLIRQRLAEAQRLLECTDMSMEQIAHACGFGSATPLRRQFAQVVGSSPSNYRRTFRAWSVGV